MAKEVRILWVAHEIKGTGQLPDPSKTVVRPDKRLILETNQAEAVLTRLVNEGWEIVAAGGGAGYSTVGFIVVQREKPDKPS